MMSGKLTSPGLLKIKMFRSKVYDIIILDDDFANKILSHDSNYVVDVAVWLKFDNSSISIREVIITSIL